MIDATPKPLGRRFFWIKNTGNIVAQRPEMSMGIESTKADDFKVYAELKAYNPDEIEMTTFEPGQYAEDFRQAKSWRFDPDTRQIVFNYLDHDNPEPEQPKYQRPLTEQIEELKQAVAELTMLTAAPTA